MLIEILALVVAILIATLGNITRMVARSVGELQPTLLSAQSPRLRRYELTGTVLLFLGLSAVAGIAVIAFWNQGLTSLQVAAFTAGLILFTLVVAEFARGIAHDHLDAFARPFLGDAAVFLPLIEQRAETVPPEEKRDEALEVMVEAGEKVGLLESDERDMISGIIRMDTTAVREIMVPRIDVVGIEVSTPLRAALDVLVDGSHSRVPVYEESLDHVVGLLYAKDLLKAVRDQKTDVTLRSMLRPAYLVPESKPVDELLQDLQQSKVHMAIVVDEYGGTAGIVTIEDVLEEIVGEIQDEYDIGEEPQVVRINDNEAVFDGRVNISQVNDTLGVELPDESDTLGGLVIKHLQKIAKVGDQVHVDGVLISVQSVTGRRIKKVRITKQPLTFDLVPQSSEGATEGTSPGQQVQSEAGSSSKNSTE